MVFTTPSVVIYPTRRNAVFMGYCAERKEIMKTDKIIEFVHGPSHFIRIAAIEQLDDGTGYTGLINLQCGAFAVVAHQYSFDTLERFEADIAKLITSSTGSAVLRSECELQFIRFEAGLRGHVTVSGEIRESRPRKGQRGAMNFSFGTHQSHLPPLLQSIQAVLKSVE